MASRFTMRDCSGSVRIEACTPAASPQSSEAARFMEGGAWTLCVEGFLQSAVPTLGKQGCENVVRHDPRKLGGANRPLFTPV